MSQERIRQPLRWTDPLDPLPARLDGLAEGVAGQVGQLLALEIGPQRLNRGGDRQANAALHRIVVVRLRWHQPTRDYLARRTAEGKTKKEIVRCLKRYVAREVFAVLRQIDDQTLTTAA